VSRGVDAGYGVEQGARVRVARGLEEVARGRRFDDLAEVHDRHAVGDVAYDAQIVRDEEVGQTEAHLELAEEIQDLGLNRDVEGRDGFVANEELRPGGERTSDADALLLTARELVRIAVLERAIEPDALEELEHAGAALVSWKRAVKLDGLAHGVADGPARIEARVGVLKDHLELLAKRAA
jgi:hypothetical protein